MPLAAAPLKFAQSQTTRKRVEYQSATRRTHEKTMLKMTCWSCRLVEGTMSVGRACARRQKKRACSLPVQSGFNVSRFIEGNSSGAGVNHPLN